MNLNFKILNNSNLKIFEFKFKFKFKFKLKRYSNFDIEKSASFVTDKLLDWHWLWLWLWLVTDFNAPKSQTLSLTSMGVRLQSSSITLFLDLFAEMLAANPATNLAEKLVWKLARHQREIHTKISMKLQAKRC